MATLKIGLIGCGGNMRGHINRLRGINGVKIVGISEPLAANIALAKEQFPEVAKAAEFTSHKQMLKDLDLDATVISTPHHAHVGQIIDSLSAGCHVLCEKPMTCTVKEARSVVNKAKRTGKVVMVSYQRHWEPTFLWMKKFIADGQLGELQMVLAQQYQSWYDHFKNRPEAWRLHADKSGGGQLNDSGSHMLDILLHITGLSPRSVSALTESFDFQVDVNSTLNVVFDNGALGSIAVIGGAKGIGTAVFEDITIIGSKAALYYRVVGQPGNQPVIELRKAGMLRAEELTLKLPKGSDPDRAFIETIKGKRANEAPPECGLNTITLTEAAWESAANGGAPVAVTKR